MTQVIQLPFAEPPRGAPIGIDEVATVTPIEDVTVPWPEAAAPFVTVARLTVPAQDPAAMAAEIEAARFDPWTALVEHRPLGEIMRARKAAYFASTQGRGA